MKRILFASIICLLLISCQKQVDVTTSNSNVSGNSSLGVTNSASGTTLNQGLLAYYSFSGNAADSSGNAADGVVNGATLVADRFGKPNSAYSFGNTSSSNSFNNYISVTNLHASLTTYSIAGWFNKAANSSNVGGSIFEGDEPTKGPGDLNFVIATNNNAEWNARNQTNISVGVTTLNPASKSINYSDGVWHSFCVTFNSNTATLLPSNFQIYIDGVLVSTENLYKSILTLDSAPLKSSGLPIILGNSQGQHNSAFPGSLDDIRVFNRVLSQSEIAYLASN